MKFVFESDPEKFAKEIKGLERPLGRAGSDAIKDASDIIKRDMRAAITGSGLGTRFANTFRARVYPPSKPSLKAAAFFFAKVNYFNVFAEGATISGKPFLWLPLPSVPRGIGNRPLSAQQYVDRLGPLTKIVVRGRAMLVGAASRGGGGNVLRATSKAVRLRKGAVGRGILGRKVPLFVGVSTVNIRQKFNAMGIIQRGSNQLPQLLANNLKADNE